jgi:hypothetical protein
VRSEQRGRKKWSHICLISSVAAAVLFFIRFWESAAAYPAYVQQASSRPTLVNGLEFVAVVETQWCGPSKPEIQLQITNRSNRKILFSTFDTFSLRVKSSDGANVLAEPLRKGTRRTQPVLLLPGTRYSLIRETTLDFDEQSQSYKFRYIDGTGSCQYNLTPMKKGSYVLSFWFGHNPKIGSQRWNDETDDVARTVLKLDKSAIWMGVGETAGVPFELLTP